MALYRPPFYPRLSLGCGRVNKSSSAFCVTSRCPGDDDLERCLNLPLGVLEKDLIKKAPCFYQNCYIDKLRILETKACHNQDRNPQDKVSSVNLTRGSHEKVTLFRCRLQMLGYMLATTCRSSGRIPQVRPADKCRGAYFSGETFRCCQPLAFVQPRTC
ncbi:hypothetical protein JTE90_023212 [Oedothorax gibbosus]|uniref:Uncharacterized protein n=1 Tax=Oedothorax gibbosus TaxID=931172 RepID=A0AAV6VL09_9ARAC|nr:hypothetical protein JTE90_023212 [Oedothorax gibbosus]